MITYTLDDLKEALSKSVDLADMAKFLGFGIGHDSRVRIKKDLIKYGLDFSHLHPRNKNRAMAKYKRVEKECPVCKGIFKTIASGDRKEKTYCSKKCCNKLRLGNRHSCESKKKTSESLKKYNINSGNIDNITFHKCVCLTCGLSFEKLGKKNKFCSISCSSKNYWSNNEKREEASKRCRKRIESKKFGWHKANYMSFPERVYKELFESYKLKFEFNYFIRKDSLGIADGFCYFLDFYFPDIKLNIEIDGQHHELSKNKNQDLKRDEALIKNGFNVLRIKWKNISKISGKKFLSDNKEKAISVIANLYKQLDVDILNNPVTM